MMSTNGSCVMTQFCQFRALLTCMGVFGVAAVASAQDAETTASVYVWGTNIDESLQQAGEVEVDNSTVFENLDFAIMGELLHRRDDWLYGLDLVYADIGKDVSASVPVQDPQSGGVSAVDADIDFSTNTTIVHGSIGYRWFDDAALELYTTGGIRYTRFDSELKGEIEATGAAYKTKDTENLTDITIGIRGKYRLDPNWSFPFLADVGTGGSEVSWQAFAAVSYETGPHMFSGGYRYMQWRLDDDSDLLDEVTYDGPVLAYSYHF